MKSRLPHIEQPGFKLPPNYLEELDNKILRQVILSETGADKNAFKVPEGYFTTLDDKLLSKPNVAAPKVIPFYKKQVFAVAVSIAAILILIFSVIPFNNFEVENFTEENSISVNEYVEDGFLDLSYFEMEELLNNEITDDEFVITYEVSEEELLHYLTDNIDETVLINEP